jgi:hypothetical protein
VGTRVSAPSTTASWLAPVAVLTAYRDWLLVAVVSGVKLHSCAAALGSSVRSTVPVPAAFGASDLPLWTPFSR